MLMLVFNEYLRTNIKVKVIKEELEEVKLKYLAVTISDSGDMKGEVILRLHERRKI